MFTKQHYNAIAKILTDNIPLEKERAGIAIDLADLFEEDNPNFDIDKWLEACQVSYVEA